MVDVATFGEALGSVRVTGPMQSGQNARISVAGTESNVAIALSRLGHSVRWVGAVGSDRIGTLVLRTLRAEGVDISMVRTVEAPTGMVLFESRLPDVVRVDYHRTGSAGSLLEPGDLTPALAPSPRIVHVTGVTMALGDGPADAVRCGLRTAREHGATTSLDVNHRDRLWSADRARTALRELTGLVDVVIASDDEIGLMAPVGGDIRRQADALLESGASQVVVKHGSKGATVHTREHGMLYAPARQVAAVDTIGAGDAFAAGYLSGILDGLPVQERLRRGVVVGAFAVTSVGDWEGSPTREELALLDVPPGSALR